MSKFIEFKDASYSSGVLLNTDVIDCIVNTGNGVRVVLSKPLYGTDKSEFQTFEYSYDELKDALTDKCRSEKSQR